MIICNRTPEQARRAFATGELTAAALVRVPMTASSWTIRLSGAKAGNGMLLSVQTLEPQIFPTLDTAVSALESIGFTIDQLKLA